MENEWPLINSGQGDEVTEDKFDDLLITTRAFSTRNKSEETAKQRIADSIPNVVRYRYDRIKTREKDIS